MQVVFPLCQRQWLSASRTLRVAQAVFCHIVVQSGHVAASPYGVFGIHTFGCQGVYTQYYTGSVYVDNDLTRMGFVGEGVSNFTVMAVKDHGPVTFKRYNKVC